MSKKLTGIRLVSVELEIGRKAAAEGAKAPQQLVTPRLARNTELPGVCDMDFDLVAFLEFKRFDHNGRKADSETVSPFGNLHATLHRIYVRWYVYPEVVQVKHQRLPLVTRRLSRAPYMAGEAFTAADISVTYALTLARRGAALPSARQSRPIWPALPDAMPASGRWTSARPRKRGSLPRRLEPENAVPQLSWPAQAGQPAGARPRPHNSFAQPVVYDVPSTRRAHIERERALGSLGHNFERLKAHILPLSVSQVLMLPDRMGPGSD